PGVGPPGGGASKPPQRAANASGSPNPGVKRAPPPPTGRFDDVARSLDPPYQAGPAWLMPERSLTVSRLAARPRGSGLEPLRPGVICAPPVALVPVRLRFSPSW